MVKPLQSTSVRLAVGYAALFAISSLLLAALLWWRASTNFDRWTDAAITADAAEISDQLSDVGVHGAIEAIRVHAANVGTRAVYLLANKLRALQSGHLNFYLGLIGCLLVIILGLTLL